MFIHRHTRSCFSFFSNLKESIITWLSDNLPQESLLNAHVPGPGENAEGKPNKVLNPKELEARVDILFYFALLWGVGGVIDESQRSIFDTFLREIITGGDGGFLTADQLQEKYDLLETHWKHVPSKQVLPDPEKGSIYDFFVDEHK